MKAPTWITYVVARDDSTDSIIRAIERAREVASGQLEFERTKRQANGVSHDLGHCSLAANRSRTAIAEAFCWVYCDDQFARIDGLPHATAVLKGDPATVFRVPNQMTPNEIRESLTIGTPAALMLHYLLSEAGAIGVVAEPNSIKIDVPAIREAVVNVFGVDEVISVSGDGKDFYRDAKNSFAETDAGTKVLQSLRSYGVTQGRGLLNRLFGR